MHNLCVYASFTGFREWGCNCTWGFGKVIRSKSVKMVFATSINRHKLWIIYVFFLFFCSAIIFDQKLFSYYRDKFDCPLYTCLVLHEVATPYGSKSHFWRKSCFLRKRGKTHILMEFVRVFHSSQELLIKTSQSFVCTFCISHYL